MNVEVWTFEKVTSMKLRNLQLKLKAILLKFMELESLDEIDNMNPELVI